MQDSIGLCIGFIARYENDRIIAGQFQIMGNNDFFSPGGVIGGKP